MARSLSLAAYLALRGPRDAQRPLADQPPRPAGTIIWARCNDPSQLPPLDTLATRLRADGDAITIITTLPDAFGATTSEPVDRNQITAFLAHWQPTLVLWMQGGLDPVILAELARADIPCLLIDATRDAVRLPKGHWMPGLVRQILSLFTAILTTDRSTADFLIQNGAPGENVAAIGTMEDSIAVLPYHEDERRDLALTIGTRQVWLAASADLTEAQHLAVAHHQASRRAHRLLLLVHLRDHNDGPAIAQVMRDHGFDVALRSDNTEPAAATQVYVVDMPDELGLWYRLAPVTYLGGTLSKGSSRDPYEPATLGSAIVHGPQVAPYADRFRRLAQAGGCLAISRGETLGSAIEGLLAADKTAALAHAAWDVTSRGADVTNRIAEMILHHIDTGEV